jgi:hypothetical protein
VSQKQIGAVIYDMDVEADRGGLPHFDYAFEAAQAHVQGKIKGPVGIPGWKDAKAPQLRFLYAKGSIPLTALANFLTKTNRKGKPIFGVKDHLAYLSTLKGEMLGKALLIMAQCGVNINRLSKVSVRNAEVKPSAQTKAAVKTQAAKSNSNAANKVEVRDESGKLLSSYTRETKVETVAKQDGVSEGTMAMLLGLNTIAARKEKFEAKIKKGEDVVLTAEESALAIKRMLAKGTPIVK